MKKISFNDYIPKELADNESCRLITTEQYQEYLRLKEEHKPLSWEELKEEAKKMGTFFGASEDSICVGKLEFDKDGGIYLNSFYLDDEVDVNFCIESDRTYDEMLAIMKALQ